MTRIEYRLERVPFREKQQTQIAELLGRLAELGRDGWQVAAIDPLPRGQWTPQPLPMLLQREVRQ